MLYFGLPYHLRLVLLAAFLSAAQCAPASSHPQLDTVSAKHVFVTTTAGGGLGNVNAPGLQARFAAPTGMALSSFGNLILSDRDNNCLRWVTPSGETHTWGICQPAGLLDGSVEIARFRSPGGLARGPDGSIYMADTGNHVIRRITIVGEVTTIAGTGSPGMRDGLPKEAMFTSPQSVILDSEGRIFVGDTGNNRIRVIYQGSVGTLAGDGTTGLRDGPVTSARFHGPVGLALEIDGGLIVADSLNKAVRRISHGVVSTLVTSPALSGPTALALSPTGRLYIGDGTRIVTMEAAGSSSTVAGGAQGRSDGADIQIRFGEVSALVLDAHDNLYASDTTNNAIRKVSLSGHVTSISGRTADGLLESIPYANVFHFPAGITLSADGTLYVADTYGHRIQRMKRGGPMETISGDGVPGYADGTGAHARLNQPRGIAADDQGNVYVADTMNNVIRFIDAGGRTTTFAGANQKGYIDGPAAHARFEWPFDVAFHKDHNVYVADYGNHAIRRITPQGIVSTVAGDGIAGFIDGRGKGARFYRPSGIAIDPQGQFWITDPHNHSVRHMTPDWQVRTVAGMGSPGGTDGFGAGASFYFPSRLIVSGSNLFVAEEFGHRVRRVETPGRTTGFAGMGIPGWRDGRMELAQFAAPFSITSDSAGFMYVIDTYNQCVRIIVP